MGMKHIRVAAIIRHQNKILLHTTKNENYWTLPGGAVENELTKEGLQREIERRTWRRSDYSRVKNYRGKSLCISWRGNG